MGPRFGPIGSLQISESIMPAALFKAPIWGIAVLIMFGAFAADSEEAAKSISGSPAGGPHAENPAAIKQGHSLFNQTCAHCHGPDASTGQPERNLRHLRVRYGSDMHDVFETTVKNGRPDKGMPVWGEVLDSKTIDSIYSYLETVQEDAE
jgi:polar amino acid transport system substrate-binding protein